MNSSRHPNDEDQNNINSKGKEPEDSNAEQTNLNQEETPQAVQTNHADDAFVVTTFKDLLARALAPVSSSSKRGTKRSASQMNNGTYFVDTLSSSSSSSSSSSLFAPVSAPTTPPGSPVNGAPLIAPGAPRKPNPPRLFTPIAGILLFPPVINQDAPHFDDAPMAPLDPDFDIAGAGNIGVHLVNEEDDVLNAELVIPEETVESPPTSHPGSPG